MRSFDFNAIQQPKLAVTLPNKEQTRISLTVPTTGLAERTLSAAKELKEILDAKDDSVIQEMYKLIAEILSCNTEHREFTADELKECLNIEHIAAFMLEYVSFIKDMKTEKN